MTSQPTLQTGVLKVGDTEVALSPLALPVLYFDGVPSISHLNGIIGATLVVTGNVPVGSEGVITVAGIVAHLKCNVPAAIALRDALSKALLLGQPVENPEGPAN